MITVDAASFSGLATLVAARIESTGGRVGVLSGRVPEDAFLGGSLHPVSSVGGLPLPVSPERSAVSWRLSPASSSGRIQIRFNAVDLTVRDQGTIRVAGDWAFDLTAPSDLAARLRLEPLRPSDRTEQEGIIVAVEAAQRSTTETLVSVSVKSPRPVTELGQPRIIVDGKVLTGAVAASTPDGSGLLLSFPATPFGKPARLEVGPFVTGEAADTGSATLQLRTAMARQELRGDPGETGAVDDLLDVKSRTGTRPPRIISFEFATSARSGSDPQRSE